MVITVGNLKGGVGKSLVTIHLACAAICRGMQVLIIDADTQGTSMDFRAIRDTDDLVAVAITTPTVHKDIARFTGYDLIIIDAGGRDGKAFRSAVAAADLLVVPILPGPSDVWANEGTIEVLREVRAVGKDLPAYILFNQVRGNVMDRETHDAIKEYEEDVSVLKTELKYHEYYKKSIAGGKGITEYRPGSAPSSDVYMLLDEVIKYAKA